jgi:hypothetical protein
MPYRIAGIDVHKKMLAVVVADVEIDGDFHFECQRSERHRPICADWPTGWSSRRSRKSSWNRPRSIGGGCGKRRMLQALADGGTDPVALAALAARVYAPPRINCATPSAPRPRCIPSTAAC